MEDKLALHIPAFEELWYRQRLLQDPATMSYNKGYDLNFSGYDQNTGCIAFPEEKWRGWYDSFIGREPERFYAYVVRLEDRAFIGEVNVHKSAAAPWYEMGIVLEAKYRGQGYAAQALKLLLKYAFESLNAEAVHNDFEVTRNAAVRTHLAAGFSEYKRENGILELLITQEKWRRNQAVNRIVQEISDILKDREPSIYLYGSSVLDDFHLGWSDIDILVLTQKQMSQEQAELLMPLRQTMLEQEPDNRYYRSLEGGMLTLSAFLSQVPDRVVYWGTSGQRITDRYVFDSFCMTELLENGVLLSGQEIRDRLPLPEYTQLYRDVRKYYETLRQYAQKTTRSYYSFGWFLDISRCIYTLRTGKIAAKTVAGEWALKEGLCPDAQALETALNIRRNPDNYQKDPAIFDYAETLGASVQRYADVLELELQKYRPIE